MRAHRSTTSVVLSWSVMFRFATSVISLGAAPVVAQSTHEPTNPVLGLRHEIGKRVEVLAYGKPLLSYVHSPLQYGHPHFHPVFTRSEILVTRSAPADHIWHNGIWFSWKFINGDNFWEGPSPVVKETRIEPLSLDNVVLTNDYARFSAQYSFLNKEGKAILNQSVTTEIPTPESDSGLYIIDLDYSFTPIADDVVFDTVPYHPSKTDWGGYAGLTYRPFEQQHYYYTNAEGEQSRDGAGNIRWKKTKWIDFAIPADGYPQRWVGVTLMDHPDNLRHPAANNIAPRDWHWNWLQLSLLFEGPHSLKKGESLALRYRVVIRDGPLNVVEMNRLWDAFAAR